MVSLLEIVTIPLSFPWDLMYNFLKTIPCHLGALPLPKERRNKSKKNAPEIRIVSHMGRLEKRRQTVKFACSSLQGALPFE